MKCTVQTKPFYWEGVGIVIPPSKNALICLLQSSSSTGSIFLGDYNFKNELLEIYPVFSEVHLN